ncbi:hypothetical protein QJS66_15215 [Kocuria rhizophila]|nr:hypothetical protein QJS66_15215 [Kocuria rhizophila]
MINSTEVYGPGVETMASLMQPLLLVAVVLSRPLPTGRRAAVRTAGGCLRGDPCRSPSC